MHNKFLKITQEMQMEIPTDPVPKKSYPYYDWMDRNEVKL